MNSTTKRNNTVPAASQKPAPGLDRIDALDLLNTRLQQVQGILGTIFMSLGNDPAQKALKNSIWASQDLLEQAEEAAEILSALPPSE
jgi:hypothetical protein